MSHYVNEIPFNMIAPAPFPCLSFIANVSRHLALIDIEFVCYASAIKKEENVEKVENLASEALYFKKFVLSLSLENSPKTFEKLLLKYGFVCIYEKFVGAKMYKML